MQNWNIATDRAQRVGGKNGVICIVIMFTPRVMVIEMPKLANFLYFSADASKKLATVWTKYLCASETSYLALQKMLWIVGFWATLCKISTLEDTKFDYFFADSAVLWYSYPRYLTHGNCKTYEPYHFLKEVKKIF